MFVYDNNIREKNTTLVDKVFLLMPCHAALVAKAKDIMETPFN